MYGVSPDFIWLRLIKQAQTLDELTELFEPHKLRNPIQGFLILGRRVWAKLCSSHEKEVLVTVIYLLPSCYYCTNIIVITVIVHSYYYYCHY